MHMEEIRSCGKELLRVKSFLQEMGIDYDTEIEYTICVVEDEKIIGTGSVEGNILKCIAIDPIYRGMGLTATIISNLLQYEVDRGILHVFIYTQPKNAGLFEPLGFHEILKTNEILFLENKKNGFKNYREILLAETPKMNFETGKINGAIVANCNPFTKGHRYLIEKASEACDFLHVFLLSDERIDFSLEERVEMVKNGIMDLHNVILHTTSDYLVSASTFPTYFYKDKKVAEQANCLLDIEIFSKIIAPMLGITKRFIGTEPNCRITNQYNEMLKSILPVYEIQCIEIERLKIGGTSVSASTVRKLLSAGDLEKVRDLIPDFTYSFLNNKMRNKS